MTWIYSGKTNPTDLMLTRKEKNHEKKYINDDLHEKNKLEIPDMVSSLTYVDLLFDDLTWKVQPGSRIPDLFHCGIAPRVARCNAWICIQPPARPRARDHHLSENFGGKSWIPFQ